MKELFYKNYLLDTLPGEQWIDAYGYDGLYEVSSLGRVKSCEKFIDHSYNGGYYRKAKILHQYIIKAHTNLGQNRLGIGFCVQRVVRKFQVSNIVYYSFHPEDYGKEGVVMHISKNTLDDRLVNLKFVSQGESFKIDILLNKRKDFRTLQNIRIAKLKLRTHKVCNACGKKKVIDEFYHNWMCCKQCKSERKYKSSNK